MPNFPEGFSMEKLKELSNSAQGQALLSQLQNQQSQDLRNAVMQAQAGDLEQAKQSVTNFLCTPAGQELMQKLRGMK